MHAARFALTALVVLVGAPGAAAADRVEFRWAPQTDRVATSAPLELDVSYRPDDGSDGKAVPVDRLVIQAPRGTVYDPAPRPRCMADDTAIRLLGRDACPAESRIGDGTLTADTGFGPPTDPFATEVSIFATPTGFVEIVQAPGTNVTLGIDRFAVEGSTLTGNPPVTPGGPPDGRTAVRDVRFRFDAGVFRTPPKCWRKRWRASALATFADGVVTGAVSESPCRPRPR